MNIDWKGVVGGFLVGIVGGVIIAINVITGDPVFCICEESLQGDARKWNAECPAEIQKKYAHMCQ